MYPKHLFLALSSAAVTVAQSLSSGQTTTLPLPFAFPTPNIVPISADIAGVNGQQTTFILQDCYACASFAISAPGLGGSLTYVLGPSTVSAQYVVTRSETAITVATSTAQAVCTFAPGSALAAPVTCVGDTDGRSATATQTLFPAVVTIGSAASALPTIQTSLPGSSVTPSITPILTLPTSVSSSGSLSSSTGPSPTGGASWQRHPSLAAVVTMIAVVSFMF